MCSPWREELLLRDCAKWWRLCDAEHRWHDARVFLAVQPVDLRGSFNRLYGYVAERLREDPKSGHWFVFTNKRRTRIKIFVFDGTGAWVLAKRLESGNFSWPTAERASLNLRNEEFGALVNGLEVVSKKNWYRQ